MIRYAALLIAIVLVALGVLGFAAPQMFIDAVAFFHVGQRVYLAAAIRVTIGLVLFLAAKDSRLPRTLRACGGILVILGLATPMLGRPLPDLVIGAWHAGYVHPWAITVILLGALVIGAVAPPREFED